MWNDDAGFWIGVMRVRSIRSARFILNHSPQKESKDYIHTYSHFQAHTPMTEESLPKGFPTRFQSGMKRGQGRVRILLGDKDREFSTTYTHVMTRGASQ